MVADLQRLIAGLGTAGAAMRPTLWLHVDLSMPQLKALIVLHHRGTVRVGEVAHMLTMSPNTTTAVLDRLEDQGLIRRRPDPTDRRAVLVALTERGGEWVAELLSASAQDFGEVLEQLSLSDLRALHQGVTALSRALPKGASEEVSSASR
jgi:DNA-binding MarR family transcriptional regulator